MDASSLATATLYRRPAGPGLPVPCAIAFLAGFCVMVIELVASRLVSGHVGMSLETWSAVIGVILGGIAVGNYMGGRLADRFEAQWLAGVLFASSGLLCAASLLVLPLVSQLTHGWIGSDHAALRMVTVVLATFFLPGAALGTLGPVIAKWALEGGGATGRTVGGVYAANAVGSIAGTFTAGFYLISHFSVSSIVWISSGGLFLVSLLFAPALWLGRRGPAGPPLPRTDRPSRSAELRLIVPALVAASSGFCVMLIELVISRFVAVHIGQSLYTWTSVIGVVLAGISIGNFVGGKLADRFESRQLVGALLLLASLATTSILQTQHLVESAQDEWMGGTWWSIRVASTIAAAFLVPAAALGSISPAVAKWALDQGYATGRTVGTIYSANVAGSIAGTFATGFYLISAFYVNRLVAVAGLGLALGSLCFIVPAGPWAARFLAAGWVPASVVLTALSAMPAQQFEEIVLAMWPVRIADVLARDRDGALTRLLNQERLAQAQQSGVFEELWEDPAMRRFANEGNVHRFLESEQFRTLREQEDFRRLWDDGGLRDLWDQLHSLRVQQEIERLRLVAGLVSRDREINYYDQYHYLDELEDYDESNYYTIKISEQTVESRWDNDWSSDENGGVQRRKHTLRHLVLDALIHGYVDVSDLSYLQYEYEDIYASVSHRLLRAHQKAGQRLQVLFLGGGSYTFPRYLSEFREASADGRPAAPLYPEIHCDIAEIDPRVTAAVRRSMGLNAACGKRFLIVADDEDGPAPETAQHRSPDTPSLAGLGPSTASGSPARKDDSLAGKAKRIWSTLWQDPGHPDGLRAQYKSRLHQAGALVVDDLSQRPDYLLDIRSSRDSSLGTPDSIDRAAGLGIPVLAGDQLEDLLRRTSHENIVTHHMDARLFVMRSQDQGQYDIIYGDAFNDFSVPAHLTTKEFNVQLKELLKPDGIFMANVIDIWSVSRFMGAYVNTLREVFGPDNVHLVSTSDGDPGESRSTFVIVCSKVPLDLSDLGDRPEDVKGLVGSVMTGELLRPVDRGGLEALRPMRWTSDGHRRLFELPADCHDVVVTEIQWAPDPSSMRLTSTQQLRFLVPPAARSSLRLRLEQKRRRHEHTADGSEKKFALPDLDFETADRKPQMAPADLTGDLEIAFETPPSNGTRLAFALALDRRDREVVIVGDGRTKEFPIPRPRVEATMTRVPGDRDYQIIDAVAGLVPVDPSEFVVRGSPKLVIASPSAKRIDAQVHLRSATRLFLLDGSEVDIDLPDYEYSVEPAEGLQAVDYLTGSPKLRFHQPPRPGTVLLVTVTPQEPSRHCAAEGAEADFPLPAYRVIVERARRPDAGSAPTLLLREVAPAGAIVSLQPYSKRRVILTDRYCPVDNLLSEVSATRIE